MGEFAKQVKSTIDYVGATVGLNYIGGAVDVVDMTGDVNVEELLKSTAPAILWELNTLDEAPRAPMWDISFLIGAKTSKDNAGTERMSLLEAVRDVIQVGKDLNVHDYTGAVAGPRVGLLHITSVGIDPSQGDRFSGMRLIAVRGKGLELA